MAKADARCRTVGNLALLAFALMSVAMAGYALRVESHHQQQWERIR